MLGELFEAPVVRVRRRLPNGAERRAKRLLDVVLSVLGIAVCALPMAAIAAAVKLGSPGPLFYRQERVGLRGHRFDFVKFRSMVVGDHQQRHRQYVQALIGGDTEGCDQGDHDEHCKVLKMTDDDRVTRVGRFLRRYSLDELPQLWNVLRGDMSLVGPRPPLPYEVDAYSDWHRQRLQALPGISGLWQVSGRSRVSFDEMVFQDLFYATNQSPPLLDLAVACARCRPSSTAAGPSDGRDDVTTVALIGHGYWGPNLLRNYMDIPDVDLKWVCDLRPAVLDRAQRRYPTVRTTTSVHDLLGDPELDAVAIATPIATHYQLAMARSARRQARVRREAARRRRPRGARLIAAAAERNLTLMVGHTFIYSPPVRKVKELLDTRRARRGALRRPCSASTSACTRRTSASSGTSPPTTSPSSTGWARCPRSRLSWSRLHARRHSRRRFLSLQYRSGIVAIG